MRKSNTKVSMISGILFLKFKSSKISIVLNWQCFQAFANGKQFFFKLPEIGRASCRERV